MFVESHICLDGVKKSLPHKLTNVERGREGQRVEGRETEKRERSSKGMMIIFKSNKGKKRDIFITLFVRHVRSNTSVLSKRYHNH